MKNAETSPDNIDASIVAMKVLEVFSWNGSEAENGKSLGTGKSDAERGRNRTSTNT